MGNEPSRRGDYLAFAAICAGVSIAGGVATAMVWNAIGQGSALLVNPDTVGAALGAALTIMGAQAVSAMSDWRRRMRSRRETLQMIDMLIASIRELGASDSHNAKAVVERLEHERSELETLGYHMGDWSIRARITFNATINELKERIPALQRYVETLGSASMEPGNRDLGAVLEGLANKLTELRREI